MKARIDSRSSNRDTRAACTLVNNRSRRHIAGWKGDFVADAFLLVLSGIGCLAQLGVILKRKIIDEIRFAW